MIEVVGVNSGAWWLLAWCWRVGLAVGRKSVRGAVFWVEGVEWFEDFDVIDFY